MKLGYLQRQIINLGREKGFVTTEEVRMFYPKNVEVEMNKLIIQGYFEKPEDLGYAIRWKFKKEGKMGNKHENTN